MIIEFQTLFLFFGAALLLAIAPGPDNIFVLTQSALSGPVAGLWVTLGLCTGLLVHMTAVALGVAAIIATSAVAFSALKYAGAIYLLYLAWQALRVGQTKLSTSGEALTVPRGLYRRGIILNVTNPKVAVFFLALLPQFIDPEKGSVTLQILVLGLVFIIATLIVFGGVAWSAGSLGKWLRQSPRIQIILNRLAAVVFVSLALKLLTARP